MNTFLKKFFATDTLKRLFWYAGTQAVIMFLAVATEQINSLAEPTTGTVIVGLILAQITKAINSK